MENQQRGDEMPLLRTQQRQPGYLIHPSDTPADRVYYEKPSRVPTFGIDVLGVTILCTVLAGMLFGALFSNVRVGIGMAGGFGLLVAFWRVWAMLGDPFPEIKETTFQRVQTDIAAGAYRSIPVNHNGERRTEVTMRNPKKLSDPDLGREYSFEGWQLDRMLSWVQQGYEGIRRDSSAHGPGLMEIGINGSNYSIVNMLFQKHGIVGDDGKWTQAGREWLEAV